MKKIFAVFLILAGAALVFINVIYYEDQNIKPKVVKDRNSKIVVDIKQKINSFKTPARVEVRNYIKDPNHRYQTDVEQVKKVKIKLDPKSDFYLELNLFTNESDDLAPLVAQFLLFDIKTQNLIQEENINLE